MPEAEAASDAVADIHILEHALSRLFEASSKLDDGAICHLLSALGSLALASLADASTAEATRAFYSAEARSQEPHEGEAGDDAGQRRGIVSAALSPFLRFAGRSRTRREMPSAPPFASGNPRGRHFKYSLDAPPFALTKLVETTQHNNFRIEVVWKIASSHLKLVASNRSAQVREYGVDALTQLIANALVYNSEVDMSPELQAELLEPLCAFADSAFADTLDRSLHSIHSILQSCGHTLVGQGWKVPLSMLEDVAQRAIDKRTTAESAAMVDAELSRIQTGFKAIQLVADDFVEAFLGQGEGGFHSMASVISCLGRYAAQHVDVNICLTAIGSLWAVADHLRKWQDAADDSVSQRSALALWGAMIAELHHLSTHSVPSVRNCALQTLFSTIASHGSSLSDEQWGKIMCSTRDADSSDAEKEEGDDSVKTKTTREVQINLFALDEARENSDTGATAASERHGDGEGYMVVHHSRDTATKQWNESRVLAMEGISRVVRLFFERLSTFKWFDTSWLDILQVLRRALLSLREVDSGAAAEAQQEIVVSAVDSLKNLLITLASEKGQLLGDFGEQLWAATLQTLLEFGDRSDLQFDRDEQAGRAVIRALAELLHSNVCDPVSRKGNVLAILRASRRLQEGRPQRAAVKYASPRALRANEQSSTCSKGLENRFSSERR